MAGVRPEGCDFSKDWRKKQTPQPWCGEVRICQESSKASKCWRPLWAVRICATTFDRTLAHHDVLLSRIPLLRDTQSAWALLLHCAGGRANYLLRVLRPELVRAFAQGHNTGLWRCFGRILPATVGADRTAQATATLPLSLAGLGLRDASRTSRLSGQAGPTVCP